MSARTIYILVAVAIAAFVTVLVLLPEDDPAPATGQTAMPPGHPPADAQAVPGAPSKANVREDFIAEFRRLGAKIDKQPESDTSDVLMYARMLLAAHQAQKALPLLQRYARKAPRNADVLLDLSIAWHDAGNPAKAEEVTRDILRMHPDNARALFNLGVLASERGDNAEARKLWQQVIARHPGTEAAKEAQHFIGQLK